MVRTKDAVERTPSTDFRHYWTNYYSEKEESTRIRLRLSHETELRT
jgi:hypothetical protein